MESQAPEMHRLRDSPTKGTWKEAYADSWVQTLEHRGSERDTQNSNTEIPGHTYSASWKFRDMQNLGMQKDRNTQILEHTEAHKCPDTEMHRFFICPMACEPQWLFACCVCLLISVLVYFSTCSPVSVCHNICLIQFCGGSMTVPCLYVPQ